MFAAVDLYHVDISFSYI